MNGADIQSYLVSIELRDHVNKKGRRRFWRQTERALLERSLVFGRMGGVCVILAVGHNFGAQDRRHVINWFVDHADVRHVHAGPQMPALDLPDAPVEGEAIDEPVEVRLRAILFMLVEGAFRRYRSVIAEGGHAVPEAFRHAR